MRGRGRNTHRGGCISPERTFSAYSFTFCRICVLAYASLARLSRLSERACSARGRSTWDQRVGPMSPLAPTSTTASTLSLPPTRASSLLAMFHGPSGVPNMAYELISL